ncbi:MAG: hypothetical protein Q7J27_14805 [Syntrophales bacterium]|nr:hypothetical protein [Syntrophales bacterium]
MNGTLTIGEYGFPISIPRGLDYSSDSIVDESDRIAEQIKTKKFATLKNNIGKELFDRLSYSDRLLMIQTAGTIDFGQPIDLENIEKEIEDYDSK